MQYRGLETRAVVRSQLAYEFGVTAAEVRGVRPADEAHHAPGVAVHEDAEQCGGEPQRFEELAVEQAALEFTPGRLGEQLTDGARGASVLSIQVLLEVM